VKRRLTRLLLILCAALPASGCVWLQNEFFVYDRAAPKAVEVQQGLTPTAPW